MWVDSGVRTAVEDVGREVALASAAAAGAAGPRLEAAWGRLMVALALEPAPELRTCPACGGECMLAATRCSSCWSVLTPPRGPAPAPRVTP